MSEFFRDLDVVPSDIVAGLVLLRHIQKREENRLIYQSLSSTLPIENKVCYKNIRSIDLAEGKPIMIVWEFTRCWTMALTRVFPEAVVLTTNPRFDLKRTYMLMRGCGGEENGLRENLHVKGKRVLTIDKLKFSNSIVDEFCQLSRLKFQYVYNYHSKLRLIYPSIFLLGFGNAHVRL